MQFGDGGVGFIKPFAWRVGIGQHTGGWFVEWVLATMNETQIRRLTFGLLAALLVGVVAVVLYIEFGSRQQASVNGDRLVAALAQYAKDLRSHGQPLPSSVTLDTLVGSGYLQPEDAKPFAGVNVIFHSDASEAYPQSILMQAHMPDGTVLAVLADGSVQALTRERFEEFTRTNSQHRSANGSLPIRPETTRATPAPGMGR